MKKFRSLKKTTIFLICFVCSITINAQGTLCKGIRTWETISSLMGETLENTKMLLKNNGLVIQMNGKIEETGIDAYVYTNANYADSDYVLPFTFLFLKGKVVATSTVYRYRKYDTEVFENDFRKTITQLELSGYNYKVSKADTFSFFKKQKNKDEVSLYFDFNMNGFILYTGEKKYQDMMMSENGLAVKWKKDI